MLKFSYLKPYKSNSFRIDTINGSLYLTDDSGYWMSHNPYNQDEVNQTAFEIELGQGHCVCTGLGLGLRETLLSLKSTVKKITVIEYNQDLINWYKEVAPQAGINLAKFEFICDDADNVKGIESDCLFLDHYKNDFDYHTQHQPSNHPNFVDIIERSRKLAKNNPHQLLWFWPLAHIFSSWAKETSSKINVQSFKRWAQTVQMDQFLPMVDNELFKRNVLLFFNLKL